MSIIPLMLVNRTFWTVVKGILYFFALVLSSSVLGMLIPETNQYLAVSLKH